MKILTTAVSILALGSFMGCQAASGALGLRAADGVAHVAGIDQQFPGVDAALHEQIALLEATDPDVELGWEEWAQIAGSIILGGFGLNAVRNRKYISNAS